MLYRIDRLHRQATHNKWMRYFTIFTRVALAAGFFPSGMVKIMGERFTSLSNNHPMGHYLEALSHTGYYYTFIGIAQVTAAILLLIPRTALLGVLLYFPIILNICILSLAVRFDGSLLSSPLMVLACLYLLCWYYDRLKYILPITPPVMVSTTPVPMAVSNKFPIKFFAGAFGAVALLVLTIVTVFDIKPRNTMKDCVTQCPNSKNPKGCMVFCDCIHNQGQPLDKALEAYHQSAR